ncbi:hypothetical protein PQQ59_06005 [Paraburkholderia aspalathi]|uniref:hypothetical protein n=1 Tax=Paraburkholderia aspalathi TaxID=1324617 RepID=UPI0038B7DE9D
MMDQEQLAVFALKGVIASLPAESQEAVNKYAEQLRAIVKEDDLATVAFSLVALELAAE